MGVLGDVRQQLGDAEVGDCLDCRRRAIGYVHLELGRNGAPRSQSGQCTLEPDVESRWVDTPGDVAQLGDGLLAPR